ncbi:DUF6798 domain-containing protein [Tropicimonas sp. TH_r6]|uniref:DUF6798 domain-containing protein n=1 Tax=Tropicimonas sp. TH_r6 TaxID=3082085 RepID=UPI002955CAE3|nr:DUF6798 domain-containing protein [Tropicimonas sp. TH_r6]MDV7145138.1 DUF6798 domain-containing protein [Tropicimonas sp. TH_r6]
MTIPPRPDRLSRVSLRAIRIGFSAMFIAATWMAPLYFSNQNTKFLHGLATAFPERLGADWTAGTADGLPLFSALVHAVAAWADPLLFYAIEAALLVVMALSLLEITRRMAPTHGRSAAFILIAAACFVGLVHPPQEDSLRGVAGQYMMRGYLQPSEFGILFLPAVLLAMDRRASALIVMALPAAIHPAYIPISGIGVAIILWDRWRAGVRLPLVATGCALALLILPPLYLAFRFAPTDPDLFAEANRILAFERIPHHSDPWQWADGTALRKLAITLAALAVTPRGILRGMLLALLALAAGGTAFVAVTGNAELALMAPWRASIVIVPLAAAILIGWLLERGLQLVRDRRLVLAATAGTLLWAGWAALDGMAIKAHQIVKGDSPDHIAFARTHQRPGDLYLTPPDMADFRLDAMVAQFVTRKTHPYLDREVIEWDRRLRLAERVFPAGQAMECDALSKTVTSYAISHVLLKKDRLPTQLCAGLSPLFEGKSHVILAVMAPG